MTRKIVHKPGDRVGHFEIVRYEATTPNGDSMWRLCCLNCGHEVVKRGTTVRQVMRSPETMWLCECEQEERRKQSELAAQARRAEVEAREREAERYRKLKTDNRLLYYTWKGMKARCYRKTHPKYKH